jgi:hypothetical protein
MFQARHSSRRMRKASSGKEVVVCTPKPITAIALYIVYQEWHGSGRARGAKCLYCPHYLHTRFMDETRLLRRESGPEGRNGKSPGATQKRCTPNAATCASYLAVPSIQQSAELSPHMAGATA